MGESNLCMSKPLHPNWFVNNVYQKASRTVLVQQGVKWSLLLTTKDKLTDCTRYDT